MTGCRGSAGERKRGERRNGRGRERKEGEKGKGGEGRKITPVLCSPHIYTITFPGYDSKAEKCLSLWSAYIRQLFVVAMKCFT